MINSVHLYQFRNDECVALGKSLVTVSKKIDWTMLAAQALPNNIEKYTLGLEANNGRLNTVFETKNVIAADNVFNNAARSLKYLLQAFKLHPDKAKRMAAEYIIQLIKSEGWNMHNESYPVQNAKASRFLVNCRKNKKAVDAIVLLGIDEFIAIEEKALEELNNALKSRQVKGSNQTAEESSKDLRTKLDYAIEVFFKFVEVQVVISRNPLFAEMVKEINVIIDNIHTSIAHRHKHTNDVTIDQTLQN